ncbi:hypothetical protein L873DRAFT_12628 [Choiromyces venosus 120613-1]|uniref:Uncharacterized protein n=1 Tax=Choiromyces venosus 120613-1 TaxID=1336337 RepID=A0A3N4K607_9PEZI|nr:hypothetical protein L873DRAFT_12628 [Choiromyces venosus 120613-1]
MPYFFPRYRTIVSYPTHSLAYQGILLSPLEGTENANFALLNTPPAKTTTYQKKFPSLSALFFKFFFFSALSFFIHTVRPSTAYGTVRYFRFFSFLHFSLPFFLSFPPAIRYGTCLNIQYIRYEPPIAREPPAI